MVSKTTAAASLVMCLSGCVASTPTRELPVQTHRFTAPLHTPLTVVSGDDLYVEGTYTQGEKIEVSKPVNVMVPGPLLAPLTVHIAPTTLRLSTLTSDWKYYCGPQERVAVSTPSAASVLGNGDCVGIRVSRKNPQNKEWVVDNSVYTDRSAIWSTPVLPSESSAYPVSPSNDLLNVHTLKKITFDGFYGRQLHFTWLEQDNDRTSRKTFSLDFSGEPIAVDIQGMVFTVSQVADLAIAYEWLRFSSEAP